MKKMKKIILVAVVLSAFISCKNDSKTIGTEKETISVDESDKTAKQSDGLTLLKGEFIYYADAAVLQTHKEVYAVVVDEKMHELNSRVLQYKVEVTDMIPVEIRGKITPKPKNEEGWPYRVEIIEILKVSKPDSHDSDDIKVGK
jgi:NlpE-like protein